MKKLLALFFIALAMSHCAIADALDDKIKNLISERSYKINENFIKTIFANKSAFYTNGSLNMARIVSELRANGLLTLKLSAPTQLQLKFSARTSPILLNRAINDTLTSMGYSSFSVQGAQYQGGISSVTLSLVTDQTPDANVLISELAKRGLSCLDIKRDGVQEWDYLLSLNGLNIPNSKTLGKSQTLELKDLSGQYWINVRSDGELKISNTRKWYARVVLYDGNLMVLDSLMLESPKNDVKVKIPHGTSFVMITDLHNANNLKGGISVRID